MRVLVDTNILLRSVQPSHPLFPEATGAVSKLLQNGETLVLTSQNIAEFWNVATRPAGVNGLGMGTQEVTKEIASIESFFVLLADTPGVYPEWKRIVTRYHVVGVKAYDARLVAFMRAYSVESILTFNVSDFERYRTINAIHPSSVMPT